MFQKVIFLLIGAGTVISAAAVAAADIRSSSFLDRCTQSKKYFTVIDCTTAADKSELVVNNPNATTIVSNCQFNGCGNIHAQTQM